MPRHPPRLASEGAPSPEPTNHPPRHPAEPLPDPKWADNFPRGGESHYRLLFDKNPLPAWVFDLHTLAFLAANEAAAWHYGYSRQEFLGLTLRDLSPPEDVPALLSHLADAPAEGEERSGSWRHTKKDGSTLFVELLWQDIAFGGRRARLLLAQDVTERKQDERELQESERRLRQLAENVRAVFWMTDARAARLLYVSPLYEEVWGRSCESLYRHPETWQQAIHPDDRASAARVFEQFVRDGRAYEQEIRVVRPDGSVRWVRDRGFPVHDLGGRVYRVAGIAEDVTDQKHRDQELRRHVRQQEVIAVLGRSALADADPQDLLDGAARLVAQALRVRHVGVWELLPGGQALRLRAAAGWGPGVVGRHTAGAGEASQAGYTLARNGPVVADDLAAETRFEAEALPAEHGLASALSVPVGGPTRPFGVLAAYAPRRRQFLPEDVPFLQAVANVLAAALDRREAEEAVREGERFGQAVLDSLAAHVAVLDRRGTIVAVNEGWKVFARENGSPDLVHYGVGTNYLDVCGRPAVDAEASAVARGLAAVLDGSLPLFTHEYPCHSPGHQRWFVLRATPCVTREGCAVVAHVDITERKLAEERLREADRRKDEFLAMLAHELRNPLAPLGNALQVLRRPDAPADSARPLHEMMQRQVQHLSRLVDDLLDVSRVTQGRIELRKEPLDLAPLVAHAVEAVRPLLDERQHELTVCLPDENVRLEADPNRLAQVLVNLLTNAAKYTDPGGHVCLSTEVASGGCQPPEEVVLRVRDDGVGIAPDMLPRVFDMFVQAERRLDRSRGGLGVGLTLVRRLVELHGGSVAAFSAGVGQGSEFVVRLPLPKEGARWEEEGGKDSASVLHPPPSFKKVLVVDDNEDAADSLGLLLRALGHDVLVAHDGPAALEQARAYRPDVAFLDLGMPGLDGYELCRRLRQELATQGALLVALTGWGQEEHRRRTKEAGFDHHLVKPADRAALEAVLAQGRRPC